MQPAASALAVLLAYSQEVRKVPSVPDRRVLPFHPDETKLKKRIVGTGRPPTGVKPATDRLKEDLRRRLWVRRDRPGPEDRPRPAESHRLGHQCRQRDGRQFSVHVCPTFRQRLPSAPAADGRATSFTYECVFMSG